MPEVVKVKRPVSVWLSQILIVLVFGLMTSFVISDLTESRSLPRFSDSGSFFLEAIGYFWVACWITGFLGMTFRLKFSRFLVIGLFVIIFGWFMFNYFTDAKIRDSWLNGDHFFNIGFLLTVFFVASPFIILALTLAFSRKVKMFFDPSLVPQVDESSSIFHEPPPPPRFDE